MGVVIKQSIRSTIFTYIGALIGMLNTLFISTHFLTSDQIGLTKILAAAAALIAALSQLGISDSGLRYFPFFNKDPKDDKGFFFYLCLVPVLGLAIFGFLYFVLKQPIASYFEKESSLFNNYYVWVFPLAIFLVYIAVFETYGAALLKIAAVKAVREVGIRLLSILAILAYAFSWVNLDGYIVLFVLVYALAALVDLVYVWKLKPPSRKFRELSPKKDIPKELRKEIYSYSFFCLFSVLSTIIAMRIDFFMLGSKLGLEAVAIYSIAYYMANIIEMPIRSTITISSPLISQAQHNFKENNKKEEIAAIYKKVANNQFFIATMAFLLIWINIENIYKLIPHGDFYSKGIMVVLFISLAKIVESVSVVSHTMLTFSKYYKYTLPFLTLLGGLTIFTNLILIPKMGLSGAAVASLISAFIYALSLILFIYIKQGVFALGRSAIKTSILCSAMLMLNFLIPSLKNPIIDAISRSFLIFFLSLYLAYKFRISAELNNLLEGYLNKIFKKH